MQVLLVKAKDLRKTAKEHILTSWLSRASFSAESTNNIKTKITHHRVMEDGCIWEGLLLLSAF